MRGGSPKKGLMIAAPQSGSGKTVLTLALLRTLKNRGIDIAAAKAGSDYIDPAFHQFACGSASLNLDPWAMAPQRLNMFFHHQPASHVLVEAMMGLFDGAADGSAMPADLAALLGLPVVLVIDCARQSHSVAALAKGFRDHRKDIDVAGVILNRIGSLRHETMLRQALESVDIEVFGAMPRDNDLELPQRHLGLIQAGETKALEKFIANAAKLADQHCDLEKIAELFQTVENSGIETDRQMPILPFAQRIAIAFDEAFSFVYPHWLAEWRRAGVELSFFSPLGDEAPSGNAKAIFLPGGYPELHAGRIAAAENFRSGMKQAKNRDALIYGECGGYMVLGEGLTDKDGHRHEMLGLLELETSFAQRKLHLGYRKITGLSGVFKDRQWKGHEFHYSIATKENGERLFETKDALNQLLNDAGGLVGLRNGSVMGSYMHLIDRVPETS